MTIVLKNNVVGYLSVAISASDTVLRLRTNDGLKFPFLEALQYCYVTLSSGTQGDAMEIVKVTYRMNDNLQVVRAQEDTIAQAFPVGTKVELRVTAQSIKDAIGEVDVTSNVAAAQAAATAAATSAASASTSADAAGSSAQAALTSSTNAETSYQAALSSAGQANTYANQASSSASNAAGSAAAASISSGTAAASSASAAGSATNAQNSANAAATSSGNASTSATQASQSASDALGSAASASLSSTTAAASAFNAAGSATNAGSSASSASTSATQASTSASNAAGSASSASTSATNAANSATASGNSATAASTSASQASTSASNAAGSASSASTSATNAANSATASGNSATAASTSASNAATSASDAAGSASSASTSATNAANSATASGNSATASSTSASQAATSATNAAGSASSASTSATNAANSATASGNSATASSTSASQAATSATNAAGSASSASTSATNAANSATASGNSASAASTSASNASTSATNAGVSASAANTSATNAAGSANNAASSASTAATQASNASGSAAAASASSTLSATFASGSQGSINSSATFADNANATGVPTNWYDWSGAAANTTRVTGIAPQPYAVTTVGTAGTEVGLGQALLGRISTGWHVLEADITLNSGALTGAGVLLNWDGGGESINFVSDTDINGSVIGVGTTGQLYKFRKLVQIVKGTTYNNLHPMTHWTGFGSIASANSITWHRCAVRAASQAEIEARQAKLDLVIANAAIVTEANTRAAADAAAASTVTTLTARTDSMDAAMNSNPNFSLYTTTPGVPDLWISWDVGESGTRVTGISPKPYAYRLVGVAGANRGIQQNLQGKLSQGWHVLEYDVTLNSGTFQGAGGHLNWGPSGTLNNSTNLIFQTDLDTSGVAPGNGTTGRLYKFRKLININTACVEGNIYAMAHWNGLGSNAAANDITFHRVAIRPASQAEIEARSAYESINTPTTGLTARITSAETAITTNNTATTTSINTLTTRVDSSDTNGSLLANPFFRIPYATNGAPPGWQDWVNSGTITQVAAPYGLTGNCLRMVGGSNHGISQYLSGGSVYPGGKYKVGAQVARGSGTFAAAGMHIQWFTDADVIISTENLSFATEPRTDGTTGSTPDRVVRYEKEMTAPANANRVKIYLMNGWDGLGAIPATDIYWLEAVFAPATISEAAIRTEASTRSTADSSLSSLINTVTASVTSIRGSSDGIVLPSTFEKDELYWTPTGGTFVNVSNIGRVYQATDGNSSVRSRGRLQLRPNRTYRVSARYRVATDATNGFLALPLAGLTTWSAAGVNLAGVWATPFVSRTVADGWITTTTDFSTATIIAAEGTGAAVEMDVYCQPGWHPSGNTNAVTQVQFLKLEDVTDVTTLNASVTTNASAIATVDGKLSASYGLTVDANGRIASMKLLSNGSTSSVKFTADTFQIFNGSTDVAPFEVTGGQVKIKSANVGTLNVGSGGVTIQSGTSGARIVISNSVIEVYDASNVKRVRMGVW